MIRQIVLDTETTGLSVSAGHRLVEIGCIEMINRRITDRIFHCYINPERSVDAGAVKVHGLTNSFLADKPVFSAIANEFFEFILGAELIIHNAPFDIGFLNAEFLAYKSQYSPITNHCSVIDTLAMARLKHPGQQNTLDALCRRYYVDNKHRDLHGALLDAKLLAEVYLYMTGGQAQLFSVHSDSSVVSENNALSVSSNNKRVLPIIYPTPEEMILHEAFLDKMKK